MQKNYSLIVFYVYHISTMSIHIKQSQETRDAISRHKAQSTILSILIAVASVGALTGILILLKILIPVNQQPPTPFPFPTQGEITQPIETKVTKTARQSPQPSTSVLAIANVITTPNADNITIPDIETFTPVEITEPGLNDVFGSFEDSPEIEFFNNDIKGRIAFVIDFSQSMSGERDKLMRSDISLLFFSGPVWSPGDKIEATKRGQPVSIKYASSQKIANFDFGNVKGNKGILVKQAMDKARFQPKWIKPTSWNIKNTIKQIEETPLLLGTTWHLPLEAALKLKPQPDTIIFMTDGVVNNDINVAKKYGQIAAKKGITINAIALLEPAARGGMKTLAELTGGEATAVLEGGKATQNLLTGGVFVFKSLLE